MTQKRDQKPAGDALLLSFKSAAQPPSATAGANPAGTDLAMFALVVISLNRQATNQPGLETSRPFCRVSSLECLQGGLKMKKKAAVAADDLTLPTDINRIRKES